MKKEMDTYYKMRNKRGLSGIVAAVVMIALVMVIAGIVWVVVTDLVSEQLSEAGSCLDVLGKVDINYQYTCYNSSSNEFLISIGIGDIDVEKVIISVSGAGASNSYEVNQTGGDENLRSYDGSGGAILPGKNSGLTYRLRVDGKPDSVKIFPVVSGKQCDATDTATTISSCLLLG